MTVDTARGIVYIPIGSASTDWYGTDRIGDSLFANTLIARRGNRKTHLSLPGR